MPGWPLLPASGSYLGGVDGPDVETLLVGLKHIWAQWTWRPILEHHTLQSRALQAEDGSEVLGAFGWGKGQQVGGEGKWGK